MRGLATRDVPKSRLESLLEASVAGLTDEAVAEARSLGAERAGDVVAFVLDAELTRPKASGGAIRAAYLAAELRLGRAVPALVRCIERLPAEHPLRHAVTAALIRLAPVSVDALLAAFAGATPESRSYLADALAALPIEDDRIPAAIVRVLEDDPISGARCLLERGDWRAVGALSRAVDRVGTGSGCDCAICGQEQLHALATAIRGLGGSLTLAQRDAFDAVLERAAAMWTPFEEARTLPEAVRAISANRASRARNAPCHCGSGKKYKKCHLAADELRDAH